MKLRGGFETQMEARKNMIWMESTDDGKSFEREKTMRIYLKDC